MADHIKILFIKPFTRISNPVLDAPLGILHLSAYLKVNLKEQVSISFLDLRKCKSPEEALANRLRDEKPDIIGASIMNFEASFIPTFAEICRKILPQAHTVIGGPYPTYNYMDALQKYDIDYCIVGEGEKALLHFVRKCMAGLPLEGCKGVACLREGQIRFAGREDPIDDLDELPFPDYGLIDMKDYWGRHQQMNVILAEKRYIPVISSRGCPYRCIYCHDIFGKKHRKRSAEVFVDEIEMLFREFGIREFHIVDDAFNIDRERMHRILENLIRKSLRIKLSFPNALRADVLELEDIQLLKKAGAYMLTAAIETASPRIQTLTNKNLDIEKVIRNINYARSIGLITCGYFMLGFPGETIEEIHQTIDLAVHSTLDMVSFNIVTPFKGTGLFEMARKMYGDFDAGKYSNYLPHSSFYKDFAGYDITRIEKEAYFRFYRFPRMFRLFLKAPRKLYFLQSYLNKAIGVLRA